jgi:hypothetical protein
MTAATQSATAMAGSEPNKTLPDAAPQKEYTMTATALRVHEEPARRDNAMTPMDMVQHAVSSGAGIDVLEKLLALQERWEANQGRKDFDEAIAAAKAEIKPVARNKTGHNAKKYADFAAYAREVDPVLARHGLSYRFRTEQDDRIKVTCILSHRGGHSETNTLAGPADSSGSKNAIQAIGSTLTYLQRYTLTQALGLAASDDDDAKTAEDHPISGAAEAAINSVRECKSLPAMTSWKEKNDPMVQKLDRNDRDAFLRAWSDLARAIRSGEA